MSIKTLCAAYLLTASLLFAKDLKINQILLSSEGELITEHSLRKQGVFVQHLLFASSLADKLADQYLDQPLTDQSPEEIRKSIIKFYQKNGHPMMLVHFPEQDVSDGILRFVVFEAKVGTVTFTGNRWFPNRIFTKQIRIKSGDPIDEKKLLNAIAWLNHNPFHHTEMVASPGKKKGYSDLEFITKDRFPLRAYLGFDDTGTKFTNENRLFAGLNWGNALNLDHLLSLQYTTSPGTNRFKSYFGSYTAFLPWKHSFTVFGAYARIHPDIDFFHSSGRDVQASARYGIPIKPLYTKFVHEFTFGFDFKSYNNDLFFSEVPFGPPILERKIDLSQFYAGYKINYNANHSDLTLFAEVLGSPAEWLPHQTPSDYGSLRPNAKPKYIYGRLSLGEIYTLPKDFKLSFLFRGQGSSGPLLPSEQFGLGGYNTVRGYRELDYLADNAVCANFEFRTPYLHLSKEKQDRLFFLVFVDYAWGKNDQVPSGFPSTQTLLGVGPGVRYTLLPYINIRVDYGFQLKHIFDDHLFGRCHFSATISY